MDLNKWILESIFQDILCIQWRHYFTSFILLLFNVFSNNRSCSSAKKTRYFLEMTHLIGLLHDLNFLKLCHLWLFFLLMWICELAMFMVYHKSIILLYSFATGIFFCQYKNIFLNCMQSSILKHFTVFLNIKKKILT